MGCVKFFFTHNILGCNLIRMVDVSNIEKLGFKYGLFYNCEPDTSWLQIHDTCIF